MVASLEQLGLDYATSRRAVLKIERWWMKVLNTNTLKHKTKHKTQQANSSYNYSQIGEAAEAADAESRAGTRTGKHEKHNQTINREV